MHQFNVAAQPLAVHAGCERRVGDDADDGGKLRPPHTPQMQISHFRIAIRFQHHKNGFILAGIVASANRIFDFRYQILWKCRLQIAQLSLFIWAKFSKFL